MSSACEIVPGRVALLPRLLAPEEAAAELASLLAETPWRQEHVRFGARQVPMPRLLAWYGDEGAVYRYSGTVNVPLSWTPRLLSLRARVACEPALRAFVDEAALAWNSVLLNLYRDGADSIGLHADDEPELGPVIASLSLGATRTFVMKWKRGEGPDVRLPLPAGSLLLMYGDCQRVLRHGLPKTRLEVGPRINLTFRRIVADGSRANRGPSNQAPESSSSSSLP